MTERAALHQTMQFKVETTPGTRPAGGANRRHPALSVDLEPQFEASTFRPMGYKFPTIVSPNKEWMQASLVASPDYNALTWPLNMILCTATPTQQAATSCYYHDFNIDSDDVDTIKTLFIEHGGSVRAASFCYALLNELSLEISRSEITLGGAIIGQRMSDNITMGTNEVQTLSITGDPTGGTFTITYGGETTGSLDYNATAAEVQAALEALSSIGSGNVVCTGGALPSTAVVVEFQGTLGATSLSLMTTTDSLTGGTTPATDVTETVDGGVPTEGTAAPILPTQINVYLDTSAAGLGTTQLTRMLKVTNSLGGSRFQPSWYLNRSEASYAAHVEGEPEFTSSLLMQADSTGMGNLTPLRAGDTRFMRIEAVGPTIEDAYTYKLYWDVALKFNEAYTFSDEEGVYAVEWPCRIVHDATWGKAMRVQLWNTVSAL